MVQYEYIINKEYIYDIKFMINYSFFTYDHSIFGELEIEFSYTQEENYDGKKFFILCDVHNVSIGGNNVAHEYIFFKEDKFMSSLKEEIEDYTQFHLDECEYEDMAIE